MTKKILVADDSITIQKVIFLTLAGLEYEVMTVGDGTSAIDNLKMGRPDLVIADVVMPGKTGYEVCRYVKNEESLKGVPVLLLTGAFEGIDEDALADAGADAHIIKPFESEELKTIIKELLDGVPASQTAPEAAQSAVDAAPAPQSEPQPEPQTGTQSAPPSESQSLTETIRKAMAKGAETKNTGNAPTPEPQAESEYITLTDRIKKAMADEAAAKEAVLNPVKEEAELSPSDVPPSIDEATESSDGQASEEATWNANDFVGEQLQQDSSAEEDPASEGSTGGGLEDFEDPFADTFTSTDDDTTEEAEEGALATEPAPEAAPEENHTEDNLSKEVTNEEFMGLNPAPEEKEEIIGDLADEDVYGYSSEIIGSFNGADAAKDVAEPDVKLDKDAEIGPLGGLAALNDAEPTSTEPHPLEVPFEETAAPQNDEDEADKAAAPISPGLKEETTSALTEALSNAVSKERIEEIIKEVTQKVIEEIAWEVVPELTEQFIKTEIIGKLKKSLGKAE